MMCVSQGGKGLSPATCAYTPALGAVPVLTHVTMAVVHRLARRANLDVIFEWENDLPLGRLAVVRIAQFTDESPSTTELTGVNVLSEFAGNLLQKGLE